MYVHALPQGANDEEEADEEGDLALLRQACVYGITQARRLVSVFVAGCGGFAIIGTTSHRLIMRPHPMQACKHAPECLDKALLPQGPKPLDLLPRLLRLLKHPQRNEEGQRAPTENAVSALLSICQGACVRCATGGD